MKTIKLSKGETKKVTLLEVKTKKENGDKIYNCFFNGTLEDAKEKAEWIRERIIISAETKEVEVSWDKNQKDYIDFEGFLRTEYLQQNPNDDEEMRITQSDAEEMAGNDDNAEFLREIQAFE